MSATIDATQCPAERPEEVLALLRDQVSLYGKLESYASQQRSLIGNDDTGPLLSLLAERQKLSAELAGFTARLGPIRRDWDVYRRGFTSRQRREADQLLTEIKALLRQVIESDEEDARLLSARKQATSGALRATHATAEALSAYRAPATDAGRSDRLDEAT